MSKQKTVKFEVSSPHARICYEETETNASYTPEGVLYMVRKFADICTQFETILMEGDLNNE